MRKFLIPALATALVMGLVIAGTWAIFRDTETSTGNTFQAGTLDLKMKDAGSYWADGIGAEWTLDDMKPGYEAYGSVDFMNFGSLVASSLDIGVTCEITDPEGPESDTQENTPAWWMASWMVITVMVYEDGDIHFPPVDIIADNLIGDVDLDGRANTLKDLGDLNGGRGVIGLPPPGQSEASRLDMKIMFHPDAGNDFQGDSLDCTFTFTLNQ